MITIRLIDKYQTRTIQSEFRATENENEPIVEGYFAVFDSETELFPGVFETIDRGAFAGTLDDDVRALVNHDTNLVLGRNKAGTLELRTDAHGLYGRIKINTKDTDAMNLYQRVARGDVSQCSFGFEILQEDADFREDGTSHFKVERVKLWEVSPCTFPAYEDTGIKARAAQVEEHKKRALEAWKNKQREEIKKWR